MAADGAGVGGVGGELGLAQLGGRAPRRGARARRRAGGAAVSVAVARVGSRDAIVGRTGITAAGLNGRAVGSR